MKAKLVALAVLAAIGMSNVPMESAEARHRLKWREWRVDPDFYFYRPGPAYVPYPTYEYDDEEFYDDPPPPRRRQAYRPEDYEPEYAPPPRKRRPSVALQAPVEPAKPKPRLMTCKKAAGIVSGFGFEAVKATGCKGKTYAFSATRDGKSFAITVNPANGELTKVKKL